MFSKLVLTIGLLVSFTAGAKTPSITDVMVRMGQQVVAHGGGTVIPEGLTFTKGDASNYNLQIGSIIKGTMNMLVMDVGADGVWIQQAMDLGFAGKQDMRELIDPNTGEIKKLIVNGKEQAPPAKGDIEVIESKEDAITVPAGQFTCLYIKAKMKQDGKETQVEQWMNPKAIPVMGMAKLITESQMGPVTAELTSFKRM